MGKKGASPAAGGYSKHLKKGGGKKAILYDALDDGQLFGQVTKIYGEGRFGVLCNDGITRIGKACNQMRKIKEKKIMPETYIIVSLRECDTKDNKCDILGFADPPKDIIKYFKATNNEIVVPDISFYNNMGQKINENSSDDETDIGNNEELNIDDL